MADSRQKIFLKNVKKSVIADIFSPFGEIVLWEKPALRGD